METVGAHEAKTHLARLLDRVAGGETLTITRRGCTIARLVPVENDEVSRSWRAAAADIGTAQASQSNIVA